MLLNPPPSLMKRLKRLPDILFIILSVHNKILFCIVSRSWSFYSLLEFKIFYLFL
jgi:hypothetical protein